MWQALVTALRARGIGVHTALEAAMIARADEEHLLFATAQGRVLCSFNVGDFSQLHTRYMAQHKSHPGMILARQQQYAVGEYMRRLLRLMAHRTAGEMYNRVEFLSAWGGTEGGQARSGDIREALMVQACHTGVRGKPSTVPALRAPLTV